MVNEASSLVYVERMQVDNEMSGMGAMHINLAAKTEVIL